MYFLEENASVLHSDLDVCDVNVCYLLAGSAVHKQKTRTANCGDSLAVICGSPCDAAAEAQLMMIKTYGGFGVSVRTDIQCCTGG